MKRLSKNPKVTFDIFEVVIAILAALCDAMRSDSSEITIRIEHDFRPPGIRIDGMGILLSHGTTSTYLMPGSREPHEMQMEGPGPVLAILHAVLAAARSPECEEEVPKALATFVSMINRAAGFSNDQ